MGKTPARNTPAFWNGTNAWVSISDLTSSRKYISQTRECITDNAITRTGIKKIPKDTLLMSFKLSLGKVAITTTDIYTNEAIMAFIDKKKYDVDIHYMYHYFQAIDWTIGTNKAVKGITLNKRALSEKVVDLPPINIQQEIAERMDNLNAVTENLQRQFMLLDELVKSQFVELFGDPHHSTLYPYKKVKAFTEVRSGGTPSRKQEIYWRGGNVRWVKTTELRNNEIYDTEEKITMKAVEHSSAKIIPQNTILIAMYGQGKTRGMTAYLKVESATNQACACILPAEGINQKYLWRFFILSYGELRKLAQGAGQPNLTGDMIKNFSVLMPPLTLQNRFAAFVEQVDKSKLVLRQLLEKQKTLKAALMQEYFS